MDNPPTRTGPVGRTRLRPPAARPGRPESPVLVEYQSDGRAVVTLNRPHADNAITTEMGPS